MTAFGPFRLDTTSQRLYRGSVAIHLTPKAASILEFLSTRPNELVTHNELLDSLWAGVHVQPEVLKVYIAELRRALRDSAAKPRYIETIHRRGYRFLLTPTDTTSRKKAVAPTDRLIGRAGEMASLMTCLRRASKGQRQFVFITGRPGIGKTTLLNAFVDRLEPRQDICTASGRVAGTRSEYEPFSPVVDALAKLATGDHAESLKSAFRERAPGWLLQLPLLFDPEELRDLRRELAGATSQRMIREFAEAMESFCQDTLTVFCLDDIHRADESTLELFEFMASRGEPARFLLVAACEAEDSAQVRSVISQMQLRTLCEEIKLDVLTEEGVKSFLDRKYPSSGVGAVLAGQLYRLSGGVPLFLSSAMHYMETQGWVLKTRNGWIPCADNLSLQELLPPTLRELLDLQVRHLPFEDQRLLEAASIAGVEFPVTSIAAALKEPIANVEDACNRILREGRWLQFSGFAPASEGRTASVFRFVHELFREVFYLRQSPPQRVERHRRIAAALETSISDQPNVPALDLLQHFAAAKGCGKSIEYLRAAARNAGYRCSGSEAAALLTEALGLTGRLSAGPRVAMELEILNELGAAYFSAGDFGNAASTWHKALRKAMARGRIDAAVTALWRLAFPLGWENPERLRSVSEAALGHAYEVEDPLTRAELILRALALCDIAGVSKPNHPALAADALRQIVAAGDPLRIASARISDAPLRLRRSEYESVVNDLERILLDPQEHDLIDVIRAEWWLSWALLHAGKLGRTQSIATAAAEHARKNGNRRVEALFTTLLAWLHVECGSYGSGQNLCRQATALAENSSSGVGIAMCTVVNAMAAIGLLDADSALRHAERALDLKSRPVDFWRLLAETITLRAQLLKQNLPEVRRSAERLLQHIPGVPERTWQAVALSACAEAAALTDDKKRAHRHIRSALDLVRDHDLPLAKWRVEAVASEILSSDSSEEAMRFRTLSSRSRISLFGSLATGDRLQPLSRQRAHAGEPDSRSGES